jgi:hypothetical protein
MLAFLASAAASTLEARYTVTYTGVVIGQGALVVDIDDSNYSAAGSAMVAGVLQLVTPGKGTAAARGQFVKGRVVPANYSGSSETPERSQEIRLAGAGGVIDQVHVSPMRKEHRDRVPVTEEHRRNVVDPMSALLMPVPGTGELIGPDACNRTLPIFDGETRYDLILSFERLDAAKDVKGYGGPLAVCRVRYQPIAGHRAGRKSVRELAENRDILVWLAPIAGTRVVIPLRVSFGAKIGTFIMQATHFAIRQNRD